MNSTSDISLHEQYFTLLVTIIGRKLLLTRDLFKLENPLTGLSITKYKGTSAAIICQKSIQNSSRNV